MMCWLFGTIGPLGVCCLVLSAFLWSISRTFFFLFSSARVASLSACERIVIALSQCNSSAVLLPLRTELLR